MLYVECYHCGPSNNCTKCFSARWTTHWERNSKNGEILGFGCSILEKPRKAIIGVNHTKHKILQFLRVNEYLFLKWICEQQHRLVGASVVCRYMVVAVCRGCPEFCLPFEQQVFWKFKKQKISCQTNFQITIIFGIYAVILLNVRSLNSAQLIGYIFLKLAEF
jgi:hypothetical protein